MNVLDLTSTLGKEKFETNPIEFLRQKEIEDGLPPYKAETVQDLINWHYSNPEEFTIEESQRILNSKLLDIEYNRKLAMMYRVKTKKEFDSLIVEYSDYLFNKIYGDIDYERIIKENNEYHRELFDTKTFVNTEQVKGYVEEYGKTNEDRVNYVKSEMKKYCYKCAEEYVNSAYTIKY